MKDIILIFSKFSKNPNIYTSYDIVSYEDKYYCGVNLYKIFVNLLFMQQLGSITTYSSIELAYNHFMNIKF